MSSERIQTVVFMRHGIACHNIRDQQTGQTVNHHDPSFWDPPLVYDGRIGAVVAGHNIFAWLNSTERRSNFELFVTSPLTRCIQTTVLAFLPGFDYRQPPPPIVCRQDVREAFGIFYPDKRREKSHLMRHWPQVEFEESMTENDDEWKTDHRESWADIQTRVSRFLAWLAKRPETYVAVVSHGVWMETLFRTYDPLVLEESQRVHNCDAFCCRIISRDGNFERIERTQHICGRVGHHPHPPHR